MECEYERRKKCDSLYIERYNKLLKEIERLKEENKKYNKWVESLNKDNHRLNNIIKTKDEGFKASIEELTDYANRIDKVLEYIKEYLYINEETGEYCLTHTFDSSNLYELMKILKEYKV